MMSVQINPILFSFFLFLSPCLTFANSNKQDVSYIKNKVSQTVYRIQKDAPQCKVSWTSSSLTPQLILKMNLKLPGQTIREKAQYFIKSYQDLWGNSLQIKIIDVKSSQDRWTVHLEAFFAHLPILNQDAKLSFTKEGVLLNLSNGLTPLSKGVPARIKKDQANLIVLKMLNLPITTPTLIKEGFVVTGHEAFHVFEVEVNVLPLHTHLVVRVNGQDGSIMSQVNRVRR